MSKSERQEFVFKGNKFYLKESVLGLLRDVNPLLLERSRLIFEYTKSIDRSKIDKYTKKINDLTLIVERLKAKKKNFSKEEKELNKVTEDYETDSECKAIITYYEQCIKSAMTELITNKNLIMPIIPKLVDGDTEKLDYDDVDIIKFLTEILQGFFFDSTKNKNT